MRRCWGCFNPRAHAGRDLRVGNLGLQRGVSIHAPTRGATFSTRLTTFEDDTFQSTRPRGARLDDVFDIRQSDEVSIHAPTRGATSVLTPTSSASSFQSTRPRGARHNLLRTVRKIKCFNPRAHAGRDVTLIKTTTRDKSFNPRAHAGRDRPAGTAPAAVAVSIHAPTRGATHFF